MRPLLVGLVVLAIGACSARVDRTAPGWEREQLDSERPKPEASVTLPAYPQDGDLVEFHGGPSGSHRYFIDAKALTVGADGIVRYTVVLKTSGGATNVSYEGIRCKGEEKRVYAVGQQGQKWQQAKRSVWEPIRAYRVNEYQAILLKDYFCPDRLIVSNRETALRALRAGLSGTASRVYSE